MQYIPVLTGNLFLLEASVPYSFLMIIMWQIMVPSEHLSDKRISFILSEHLPDRTILQLLKHNVEMEAEISIFCVVH